MAETIRRPIWILLLVLNYAGFCDAGNVYRYSSTKYAAQDGTAVQASLDPGLAANSQGSWQIDGFDSSMTGIGSSDSTAYTFQDSTYTSSFQPLTSIHGPTLTNSLLQASGQQIDSAQPGLDFQNGGVFTAQEEGSSGSQTYSYTSSFAPSASILQPVQSAYQLVTSTQPLQSSPQPDTDSSALGMGSSGSSAYFYTSSFKPSTSVSKPLQSIRPQPALGQSVQAAYQQISSALPLQASSSTSASKPAQSTPLQQASGQSAQSTYQLVASAQPVLSSSPSGFVSQDVGFDASATMGTGSMLSFYQSSSVPSTSISKPVQSAYQQVTLSQPAQSSYPSGINTQNVGSDSSVNGMGSSDSRASSTWGSSYISSYELPTGISKPVQSSSQQVALAHPVQRNYQDVPYSQSSYGASLSGVTAAGSRSVYTPSDSTYLSSCKPSTSSSKPDQSTYVQVTANKPVQSSYLDSQNVYQPTWSRNPVQMSYSSGSVALPAQGLSPRPDSASVQAASSQDNSEVSSAGSGLLTTTWIRKMLH